jgi:gluconolactonase
MIWVFAPSGRVLETHPFPGYRPTNCAFAGPDLQTLYVTGAESGLHRAETDRTGYLGPP